MRGQKTTSTSTRTSNACYTLLLNNNAPPPPATAAASATTTTTIQNLIQTNTLIHLYVKEGRLSSARRLFDGMPDRNVVSWSALMAGYVHSGLSTEALSLFSSMIKAATHAPSPRPQRVCTPHHHLLLFPHPGSGARQAVPHLCAQNRIGFALDRTLATLSFTCTRGAPTWMGPSGSLSPCHHREPTATSSRPIQSSLGSWNAAISMRRWRWHGGQPKVSGPGTLSHLPPSLVSALVRKI
ncbi:hypothetical protein MRB53_021875 [Persea americana]|uniref:Uncharacterized protein n=1 Tax=Persea americana TaxID=3435 RepID=A0ACC2L5D2_PERAE|nr:hypothetical protein MRB53_021875 [Persea americana]